MAIRILKSESVQPESLGIFYQELNGFIQTEGELYLSNHELRGDTRRTVMGRGAVRSLLVISDAPGKEETQMRTPFVGKSGEMLEEVLSYAKIDITDIFLTYTLKYRPLKLLDSGTVCSRTPTSGEIEMYVPSVINEINFVNPKIIAVFGNTALRALLGKGYDVKEIHGRTMLWNKRLIVPMHSFSSVAYDNIRADEMQKDAHTLERLYNEVAL